MRTPSRFDLLIVDETHRLNQRASQASGQKNTQFRTINERLFGEDDLAKTQLDWIIAKSDHQIFLLDSAQSVRPHDVSEETLDGADEQGRRSAPALPPRHADAGPGRLRLRRLRPRESSRTLPPEPQRFDGYDLRMYDDLREMYQAIRRRDSGAGPASLLARTVVRGVVSWLGPWRPSHLNRFERDVRRLSPRIRAHRAFDRPLAI